MVAATLVHADDEIMLITDTGVLVRTRVAEIRELGRATQGVTLIALDEGAGCRPAAHRRERRERRRSDATDGADPSDADTAAPSDTSSAD